MPPTCTICTHAHRDAINQALVAGEPYRSIAQRFAASPDAVLRHKAEHLPVTLAKSAQAAEVAHADSLLDQMRDLQAETLAILNTAREAGELRTALYAITAARGNVELLAKLLGRLDERTQTNVAIFDTPEWQRVQDAILHALRPFPDARAAVITALKELPI